MTNVGEFLRTLSETDFDERYLEIARSESFSAVASGVGTKDDLSIVRCGLIKAKTPPGDWCQNDDEVYIIARGIAERIMRRKKD